MKKLLIITIVLMYVTFKAQASIKDSIPTTVNNTESIMKRLSVGYFVVGNTYANQITLGVSTMYRINRFTISLGYGIGTVYTKGVTPYGSLYMSAYVSLK